MGFLWAKAVIDGEDRYSAIAESALPHMPAWTPVDPDDVRPNPWDFEEPDDDSATPDIGPATSPPDPDADQQTTEAAATAAAPEAGTASAPKSTRRQATHGDDADTSKE